MLRELFAEVHALKGSVGVCRGRVELELALVLCPELLAGLFIRRGLVLSIHIRCGGLCLCCLLYTSDAADE